MIEYAIRELCEVHQKTDEHNQNYLHINMNTYHKYEKYFNDLGWFYESIDDSQVAKLRKC